MALVKFDQKNALLPFANNKATNKNQLFPLCTQDFKTVNYSIDKSLVRPYINFKHLEWLIDLDQNSDDKNQAHELFMQNYRKIFEPEKKPDEDLKVSKQPVLPAIKREKPQSDESELCHDIRVHLDKIHVFNKTGDIDESPEVKKMELLKRLRKLVKKFPFERSKSENREIYEIIIQADEFRELFPTKIVENEKVLEKLCSYAVLETCVSQGTPILGNLAFYMILKGKVQPLSRPHLNKYLTRLRPVTPEASPNAKALEPGECFGTITELKDRELTTRMFRVMTLEDECEFLKISTANFIKVKDKIQDEDRQEKFSAIKKCPSYSSWPKHAIEELMNIFEWRDFPQNTILTSEGYRCPFLAFINKGTCVVLRKVDVPYMNPKTKKKEKRMKQVVIGNLKELDTFGEYSCTMKEPMHCSIVTEVDCKIGIILAEKIPTLDNITLRLLLQTNNRMFADLTQEELYAKHISQEKKKEWKKFKATVVQDVMEKYSIMQGHGKHINKQEVTIQETKEYSDLNTV